MGKARRGGAGDGDGRHGRGGGDRGEVVVEEGAAVVEFHAFEGEDAVEISIRAIGNHGVISKQRRKKKKNIIKKQFFRKRGEVVGR